MDDPIKAIPSSAEILRLMNEAHRRKDLLRSLLKVAKLKERLQQESKPKPKK